MVPDSSRIIFLSKHDNERLLLERPADSTGSQTVVSKAPETHGKFWAAVHQ
jgi:hypothetical protein